MAQRMTLLWEGLSLNITNELLASVFAESSAFCGREEVLHAIMFHQLMGAGIAHTQIAREQLLLGGRADIVLYGEGVGGDFVTTRKRPRVAIEIKGGAYGDRNALRDELDSCGYCDDMAKLEPEARRGVECWFICVDMPELGRAVSPLKAGLVAEQCHARGLAFAYYCQGEERFLVSRPTGKPTCFPIAKTIPKRKLATDLRFAPRGRDFLSFAEGCLAVKGHEANITTRLYEYLRTVGYGASQLSLETYFSFAVRPGERMQSRPDLVVFDADFDGRFNLYRNGDRRQSNDQNKLAHISTIFEVKGGASMFSKSDRAILETYSADIKKLRRWRDAAAHARNGTNVRTIFLGVDGRPSGLPASAVDALVSESRSLGAGLIYISRNRMEVSEC